MSTIADLPKEILSHIFQFYLETENQEDFLRNISHVCTDWHYLCRSSIFWIKFDGTLSHKKMMQLFKLGYLNNTVELTFSKTQYLSDEDAEKLFHNLKNLKRINLSCVSKFSRNTFSIIAGSCSELEEIQIINKEDQPTLPSQKLKVLFAAKGGNLTTIKLSYCHIANASQVLRSISEYCPNLEYLLLTNISAGHAVFPTNSFQLYCPKLKILHLDQSCEISKIKHPLGFVNLETFSYVDSGGCRLMDENFESIVFNSPSLRFLALANCKVSVKVLCSLSASSVKYLYLGRSKIVDDDNLGDVLEKWCHTLKEVEISHSHNTAMNQAILNLITLIPDSQLEFLDLSFTPVVANVVKKVLENCKQLKTLDISGCRNLGRGMKKTYSKKSEFEDLLEKLTTFISTNDSTTV